MDKRQLLEELWAALGRDIEPGFAPWPDYNRDVIRAPKHSATDLVEIDGVWMTPEDAHARLQRCR